MARHLNEIGFLNLPNVVATAVQDDGERIRVEAETLDPVFEQCCSSPAIVRNGYRRRQTICDVPHGKPVSIAYRTARASCQSCRLGATELVPGKHPHYQLTQRLYDMIGNEALVGPAARVSRMVGVGEGTVREVLRERISSCMASRAPATPQILGLDEVKAGKQQLIVLCDLAKNEVFDVLLQAQLWPRLKDLSDRHSVEVLCTDLEWKYGTLHRELLPQAIHVADKFHVLRRANHALEKTCHEMTEHYRGQVRQQILSVRPLLKRREHRLTDGQRRQIAEILRELPPTLIEAYQAKEGFYRMYDVCGSAAAARAYYEDWRQSLTARLHFFKRYCVLQPERLESIFNYFDHRVTNAYVEAVNGRIAEVIREGRGYDFETLRGKMLLAPRPATRR